MGSYGLRGAYMLMELTRVLETPQHTLGFLRCGPAIYATLEDPAQPAKVAGKTRIPPGNYDIDLRTDSPMASRYRQKFGAGHKGMIWLRNVPNFTYIYIHIGNSVADTEGCILVGQKMFPQLGTIEKSTYAYQSISEKVFSVIDRESVGILIREQFL